MTEAEMDNQISRLRAAFGHVWNELNSIKKKYEQARNRNLLNSAVTFPVKSEQWIAWREYNLKHDPPRAKVMDLSAERNRYGEWSESQAWPPE